MTVLPPGIPPSILPNQCPDGIVIFVFDPDGKVLSKQKIAVDAPDELIDQLATLAAEHTDHLESCVVAGYDGDTGRLMMNAEFER